MERKEREGLVGVLSFFLVISRINTSVDVKVLTRRKVMKVKGVLLSLSCLWYP